MSLESLIELVDKTPSQNLIIPFLYLGSVDAFKDRSFMKDVSAVVSITRIATEEFGLPPDIASEFGNHLDICLPDTEEANISKHFDECIAFISEHISQKRIVLVHCAAGISRSATVVAAYLIKTKGLNAAEALRLIKERRQCIRPNDGFLKQLLEFEKELLSPNNL